MKTSIVMATYNGEQFIREQMDSIFTQTKLPDQLVIVDDASTDGTRDIVIEYKHKFSDVVDIKVLFRDTNVGYIQNFIDGIGMAENELILLCDQDDIWSESKIAYINEFFKKNPTCITLHTSTDMIDIEGKVIQKDLQKYDSEGSQVPLLTFIDKVNYSGMSMAFKKSQVYHHLIQYLEQNIVLPTHDWVIAYIACQQDGFYTSNKVLTYRRFTGNNVALRLNNEKVGTIAHRIQGIETYMAYYLFLQSVQKKNNLNYIVDAEKYIKTSENRISYLHNRKIVKYLLNVFYIEYYPSKKAYIADGIVLFKRK